MLAEALFDEAAGWLLLAVGAGWFVLADGAGWLVLADEDGWLVLVDAWLALEPVEPEADALCEPHCCWAACVFGPMMPSIAPGSQPLSFSDCCSWRTSSEPFEEPEALLEASDGWLVEADAAGWLVEADAAGWLVEALALVLGWLAGALIADDGCEALEDAVEDLSWVPANAAETDMASAAMANLWMFFMCENLSLVLETGGNGFPPPLVEAF